MRQSLPHNAGRPRRTIVPLVFGVPGLLFGVVSLPRTLLADDLPTAKQLAFFEARIRPVLVERCHACHAHASEEIGGGLLLDTREGIRRGGDSGPAVVPGKPSQSLLIAAIRHVNKDLEMPPDDAGGKLADDVIHDFERWITDGAADPRDGTSKVVAKYDTSKAHAWWSFQPRQPTAVPTPRDGAWSLTDLDRFVRAKQEDEGLTPNGDASPQAWIRRVAYDLTGLPPTSEEIEDFVSSRDAKRHERVVDRLLASPAFGERWGRHWLDVARFAESSGKDVNVVFPHAWRYRDYVIESFRSDKPFDRFLREQLAGDLIPTANDAARAEQTIATGFLAVGPKSLNETIPRQFAVDLADEQIDAVTQAFLGLTVACARCHDHKFDPVTQRDYTALAGIFVSSDTKYGTSGGVQGRNTASLVPLPGSLRLPNVAPGISQAEYRAKNDRLEKLREERTAALRQRAGGRTPTDGLSDFDVVRIMTQIRQIETELSVVNADGSPRLLAMGVGDKPATAPVARGPRRGPRPNGGAPAAENGSGMNPLASGAGVGRRPRTSGFELLGDSPLFVRGNITTPGEPVPRGVPAIVAPKAERVPAKTSGRLQLADALADPSHPLTARVYVNRVWHWLFGQGLVTSVDNFGTTGDRPSHPELLDNLAERFIRNGWSTKRLIREIVLSRTYRLSSAHTADSFVIDPDNRFLWRHEPRRLEAEEIRDAMLFVAGRLDRTRSTGSLIGRVKDGPIGGERMMALTEREIAEYDDFHRSVYLPIARNVQPAMLAIFDLPDASAVSGARATTNVPSQALFLLNGDFVAAQAKTIANEVLRRHPGLGASDQLDARLATVFHLTLARLPNAAERSAVMRLSKRLPNDAHGTWTGVARGLLASAEFRLVE